MDKKILDIIVCPQCKGKLNYDKSKQELICSLDQLAFAVNDGIPVMLLDEARSLVEESEA